jgi:hypothetical protein
MKSRVTAAIVCLLYLSAALVIGVVHHHHDDGPFGNHSDCAACAWAINAVSDAPQVSSHPVFGCTIEDPLRVFDAQPYLAPSFSFSASRAPPVTPA